MRNRRALLALAPVALLPACGFHLRGLPEFGFASLYIEAPSGSLLAQQLQRALEGAGTQLLVLREPDELARAQAILGPAARAARARGGGPVRSGPSARDATALARPVPAAQPPGRGADPRD